MSTLLIGLLTLLTYLLITNYIPKSEYEGFNFTDSGNDSSIFNIDDIYTKFSSEWDQGLDVNPVVFYSLVSLY